MAHRILDDNDLHRLETIKRGSENAPKAGYVSIKSEDVIWLVDLVELPPNKGSLPRTLKT